MSIATLERAVLAEARVVTGNAKLRKKDLLAWSTGPVKAEADNEKVYRLPEIGVNIVVKVTT